jgi:hypothetical protein
MRKLPKLLTVFLIIKISTMPVRVAAKDGFLFKDTPPVSIHFHGRSTEEIESPNYYISITNTSDETIHDVTFSKLIGGSLKKKVVVTTIPPHKSETLKSLEIRFDYIGANVVKTENNEFFVSIFDITGPNSGLVVTCKGFTKPLPVDGWWEGDKEEEAQKNLEAAKQGDPQAQAEIGVAYYFGAGIPQRMSEGIKWAKQSVEAGNFLAMRLLVGIYSGKFDARHENLVEAMKWMLIMARYKEEPREEDISNVEKKITDAQIAEAQRLANAWKSPESKFIEQSLLPKLPQKQDFSK